jgi:hypothetical protein
MTFLRKLGIVLLKGVQIATGLAPLAGPLISTVSPGSAGSVAVVTSDLNQIAAIIAQVEAMGQALSLKGTDKLKAAGPLVAQIIVSSSLLVNKKIADPNLFNSGAAKIADGMADVLNSIHADSMTTADKTQ